MKVIKQSEVKIDELAKQLKDGAVIVYPTETCYGLGCDATNAESVNRLFQIKQRQKDKAVLALMSGLDMARRYVEVSPALLELSDKYWPGPLTVVLPLIDRDGLAEGVVAHDNSMAIRVTDHHFAKDLCAALDAPLVSTSANISALESPYDIESVLDMYKDADYKPDIVIDAGTLVHRSPSTIVKLEDGGIKVLRQGDLRVEL